jgi:hypothetical protein
MDGLPAAAGGGVSSSHATIPIGYTKYPHRVAGASVNMTARPTARRHAAARASLGGRMISHTTKPTPAAASRPTAA